MRVCQRLGLRATTFAKALRLPASCTAYIARLFLSRIGPFRWCALWSWRPGDIYKTGTPKVKELGIDDSRTCTIWLRHGRASELRCQGLPAAHLLGRAWAARTSWLLRPIRDGAQGELWRPCLVNAGAIIWLWGPQVAANRETEAD